MMTRAWPLLAGVLAAAVCVTAFGNVDFTKELPDDPNTVLLLHFNEGQGTPRDSSTNGRKVTLSGAEWLKEGRLDASMSLANGTLSVAHTESFVCADAMTVEVWIKPTAEDVGKGYHIVCHKRATQVSRLYLVVHNGVVQAYPGLRGKTVLRADRWYHIAYIVTGTKEKGGKEYIFLNGVLDATSASMWEGMTDNTILKIGGLGPKSERYQGLIDELRISNVARTYPGMAKEG